MSEKFKEINGVHWGKKLKIAEKEHFTFNEAIKSIPIGKCMPSYNDFERLLDEEKVMRKEHKQFGVTGMLFTDKTNNNKLFLPYSGYKESNNTSKKNNNTNGYYWCCYFENNLASNLNIGSKTNIYRDLKSRCFSVIYVKDITVNE
ncbi:MAG: hypothetical protein FWC39_07385 [Bacteroidetes bacterium]|nr:hypothetical protein [Bacteroidota bacterium]